MRGVPGAAPPGKSDAPSQATRDLVTRTVSGGWIIARALSLVIWRRNMAGSSQSPPDQRLLFVRLNARYCGFMTQAHSMQNAIEIDALSKPYEGGQRSEQGGGGQECGSTCRSRWAPDL